MYPAQALRDELYTVSDLPDSLIIVSGDFQQEMTKTEGFSPAYQGTNSEIFLTEVTEGNPAFWDIFYNPGAGGDILSFGQSCLVDGIYVKDQFADTYTVSGPISGTVTRESVCVWRDSNLRLTNFGFQWKVNGNNKTGLQNTPVGSYAGGYSVS
jgi:hypothetical protein